MVFAFGSPFDFRFSMSQGIVSGTGRSVGVIRDPFGDYTGYENFIQVDAAINPGNSGGPLTDHRGQVIGMNTAIATGRRNAGLEEGQFAGIGLAIPLNMIEPVVTQLIATGVVTKGYMGVSLNELDPRIVRTLRDGGFPGFGVAITRVVEEGPSAAAGLQAGDIITHVGGAQVESRDQLRSAVSSMLPGDTARFTIWRVDDEGVGGEVEIAVVLERLPTLQITGVLPADQDPRSIEEIGIARMTTATPDVARRLGVPYQEGVLIETLVPGSSLSRQVTPGSTLVEIAGEPVTSTEELINELRTRHNLRRGVRATVIAPEGTAANVRLILR